MNINFSMGNCCQARTPDIIDEIFTMDGFIKLFEKDREILSQRKEIFHKFKKKNSIYTQIELEYAQHYKVCVIYLSILQLFR